MTTEKLIEKVIAVAGNLREARLRVDELTAELSALLRQSNGHSKDAFVVPIVVPTAQVAGKRETKKSKIVALTKRGWKIGSIARAVGVSASSVYSTQWAARKIGELAPVNRA